MKSGDGDEDTTMLKEWRATPTQGRMLLLMGIAPVLTILIGIAQRSAS